MKKAFSSVLISSFFFLLAGCQKFKGGCTDPLAENYSTIATKNDGSCTYYFYYDVQVNSWAYYDGTYYATIFWDEINLAVIKRGSISVFRQFSSGEITELPYTYSYTSGYHSYWNYEAALREVTIFRYDSDLTDPGFPGMVTFKIAVSY